MHTPEGIPVVASRKSIALPAVRQPAMVVMFEPTPNRAASA
jgi:hypothetical protein